MTAHKHAALMLQYAQDAAETNTPWRRWQFRVLDTERWMECVSGTGFSDLCEYRRKPSTMTYTVTIPEPLQEAPEVGTAYFVAQASDWGLYIGTTWTNNTQDNWRLVRGLCFATQEDAVAAAEAMMPIKGDEA